ncbi:hypothetical protein [Komagataeibacter sp. FNDCF1]|uniref:hypothetical protein n=1 Tax=Komagataeibacter sp. FNDCF1 TaxID=2878681 RepID=UPI00351CC96A|nr:hypothetical protein [Komagataeibacter sp. FNDCF1]
MRSAPWPEKCSPRPGLDAVQVDITIASICHYYFTNRHAGLVMFSRNFCSAKALRERPDFNIETILHLICLDRTTAAT